jgi:hypothetical protein
MLPIPENSVSTATKVAAFTSAIMRVHTRCGLSSVTVIICENSLDDQ